MPNALALLMLAVWPLVVVQIFRRLPPDRALIWSILGGYLLLPPAQAAFDLPLLPALDKVSIPNLAALFACLFVLGRRVPLLPRSRIIGGLLLLFVLSPLVTVLTNPDPIRFGVTETSGMTIHRPMFLERNPDIPGLRIYDAVAAIGNQIIFILPFFLARHLLASPEAHREVLRALLVAGLFYSLPMLIEIALSPQLNIWIYGFFQHDFSQMIRGDGYRPIVFLPHGLWMALLAMMWWLATLALLRHARPEARPALLAAALYLGVLLALCQSLGPLLLALALAPLIVLAPASLQVRIAACMAVVALAYPLLRGAGLVPLDALLHLASNVNPERAQSLLFRITNEDMLLDRAAERAWFGWGSWGRNQVFDPMTGEMLTVTDGYWIIVIGTHGWLGYIAEFGLLTLPLILLALRARRLRPLSPWVAAVALLLGANLIDLMPNATLVPLTWLLAGAVLGAVEAQVPSPTRHAAAEPAPPSARRTVL